MGRSGKKYPGRWLNKVYTLNPTITFPPVNRCRVVRWSEDENDVMDVQVQIGNAAQQLLYGGVYHLVLRNDDTCTGLRINPSPTGYFDAVQYFSVSVPGAADAATAAMVGTRAQRRNALEAYLVSAGLLPSGA